MSTATLSTKSQLVIPSRLRRALHLRAGGRIKLELEGATLRLRRDGAGGALLVSEAGGPVMVAPAHAPRITPENIKAILAEFP